MLPTQAKALGLALPTACRSWINIKRLAEKKYGVPVRGMTGLLDYLGIKLQGTSSASDC